MIKRKFKFYEINENDEIPSKVYNSEVKGAILQGKNGTRKTLFLLTDKVSHVISIEGDECYALKIPPFAIKEILESKFTTIENEN